MIVKQIAGQRNYSLKGYDASRELKMTIKEK